MDPETHLSDCDGWLVRQGDVLASLRILATRRSKLLGVWAYDNFDCPVLIRNTRSVHTFGLAWDLDVAFLDADNVVIKMLRLQRNRVTAPIWRSKSVLEAPAGTFAHWELHIGEQLEVRE